MELKRQLGVSYKTAWLIKHKLLQTMLLREEPRRLDERVEIDDAYLGGEKASKAWPGFGEQDRICGGSTDQRAGQAALYALDTRGGFTHAALTQWAASSLAPTAHELHVVGGDRQAVQRPEFRWINTILGNLKTALNGTYHAINHAKYAHRYLAEFAYRFNRRFDLAAMVPRLLRAAVTTKPHPLSVLRLSEAGN